MWGRRCELALVSCLLLTPVFRFALRKFTQGIIYLDNNGIEKIEDNVFSIKPLPSYQSSYAVVYLNDNGLGGSVAENEIKFGAWGSDSEHLILECGEKDPTTKNHPSLSTKCVCSDNSYKDCNDICLDVFGGYLGDGWCDDGTYLVDFMCDKFYNDEGDCETGSRSTIR